MIRPRTRRREQLGEFLTSRRRVRQRSAVGLPPSARNGDAGLSREEVATLSGVSATWYTWLEQGRDTNVSRQVITAVARVLDLSDAETDYVLGLVERQEAARDDAPAEISESLQHLLDALDFPAFAVAPDWTIAGWNSAYEWLYPAITSIAKPDRSLIWLIYTDSALRRMLPDWDTESRHFLAEFRVESGVRLSTPGHRALIDRLSQASADFREQWAEQTVERFSSRRRTFDHHERGLIEFDHHRLIPSEDARLHVVMYVPVSDTE